jgi:Mor family transcriptional regulator
MSMIPDGYKECHTCNEIKPIIEFYNSAYKNPLRNCKVCYKKYHTDKIAQQMENKGGSDAYYADPDRYTSTIQKVQTFMVMELCGWTYTDGVWWKKGIKTVDKVWECFEERPKVIRKKQSNAGRKIKKGVWNCKDDIIKRIEAGERYSDVADIYECSHTTLRTIISEYRNEKRAN